MTDKESDTGKFYTNYSFEYPNENVVVATSSFQSVPSNKLPLINLTMNGILRPSEEVHEIKMKFEGDIPQKDNFARSYGTFVLCKGVYNARRIVKHRWNKETKTLRIFIILRRAKVRLKRPAQFSFSIQINDWTLPDTCYQISYKPAFACCARSNGTISYCKYGNCPYLKCKTNYINLNTCLSWSNKNGQLTCIDKIVTSPITLGP